MKINYNSFDDIANVWLHIYKKNYVKATTFAESYERTVKNYILPYFGGSETKSITPLMIRQYLSEMALKYSDSTLSKILICLSGIFAVAVENNFLSKSPTDFIKLPHSSQKKKEKRTYNRQEADDIISFSYTHENGIYIHILLELGLRCSELCGLKWSDIDLTRKIVHIQRACTTLHGTANIAATKNASSNRELPLSTELTLRLLEFKSGSCSDFIIHSKRNTDNPITPSSFTKLYYNKFFADYGVIDWLSPHELRHTCGTLLYARTKDIYAVSKYLGHSSVNITAKLYVHSSAEILRTTLNIV